MQDNLDKDLFCGLLPEVSFAKLLKVFGESYWNMWKARRGEVALLLGTFCSQKATFCEADLRRSFSEIFLRELMVMEKFKQIFCRRSKKKCGALCGPTNEKNINNPFPFRPCLDLALELALALAFR